jgi:hypothetical protein
VKLLCISVLCAFALSAQQQSSGPVTDQRIIDLVKSGLHEDELKMLIATAPQVNFDLTPAGEQQMMQAGVSEEIIKAMAARESGTTVVATPLASQATPLYEAPANVDGGTEHLPRADIFAGYSYLNVDTNGVISRQSLNGWETSVAVGPRNWFAVEGDFGGYYKPSVEGSALSAHAYTYLAGPRFNARSVFVHVLAGGDTLTGSAFGVSASQTSFAVAIGGGVQSKPFAGHWAIRGSADYLLSRHHLFTDSGINQNNFRVGAGIVCKWNGPTFQ